MTTPPIDVPVRGELLTCPGRFAFFLAWTARRPRRTAVWQTTALFGGIGCSILHVHNAAEATLAYLLGFALALVVMMPWADAERWINGGWRR